eukprot:TRINITY_DN15844_c0_g1_i1.p1 TRINITY_DN15844_c0_g1~~TRINITY_DN15844_c0_g1_i1.p1  ORF type:complete len:205 (-),score=53.12 TRINITY_DN15844_c0_g1_i1:142-756(-)
MSSKFKFTNEPLDELLFSDIQNLNALNASQLGQLIDILLTFLAEGSALLNEIAAFAQEHGVNPAALRNTVRGALFFFRGAVKSNLNPDQIRDDLVAFGVSEEVISLVLAKWKSYNVGLIRSVIGKTLQVNEVVDMEWSFGATASNTELRAVGATYLQLNISLDKGNKTDNETIELSLPQFYDFFREMEAAKRSLDQFGSYLSNQ